MTEYQRVMKRGKDNPCMQKEKRLQDLSVMISIVCVYNNELLLSEYLLQSLKYQTALFELITLDNTKNTFKSAAEALNYGGRKAHGKYIMFVHQDIRLALNTWIEDAERTLDSLPNLGAAGIAGKRKGERLVVTSAMHGSPPSPAGTIVKEPVRAETIDECLIVIPRGVFDVLKFDEITCDSWHLYAVDYCLSSKLLGFETYVLPLTAYHLSSDCTPVPTLLIDLLISKFPGQRSFLPKEYYETLKKVLKKHKKYAPKIYTVSGDWVATRPFFLQRTLDLMAGIGKILRSLAMHQES
jgi:Glycosyltransferase like family